MFTLPDNILQFLRPFYIIFSTQKTFAKMLVLFTGAIFCHGGRTVCSCLKAIGMHGEKAFSNYYHVLNRCKWNSLKGTKKILELIPTSSEIILVVDEHLERRKGKKIKAKGTHRKVSWYRGMTKKITGKVKKCIWYAGKPEVYLPVFAGWVELKKNDKVILAVIGEKIEISLKKMVELYVKRWNIEVTFRECRDHLGIETQRQWSDLAIIRSTPLLFCMYTIIVVIGNNLWSTGGIEPLKTAWYDKKHLTFSDLLQSVRLELWKHKSDSREKDESKKNISMEEALFEHLAVMGV